MGKALMAAAAIVAVTVSALGYTVSDREIFVDHAKNRRSGHMGHALVNAGDGRASAGMVLTYGVMAALGTGMPRTKAFCRSVCNR